MQNRALVVAIANYDVSFQPPIWNSARILCESGYRVKLYTSGKLQFEPPYAHPHFVCYAAKGKSKLQRYIVWARAILSIFIHRPKAVHIHNYAALASPMGHYVRALKIPVVYEAHELHEAGIDLKPVKAAAKVICPGPQLAQILRDESDLAELPAVVPNTRFPTDLQPNNLLRTAFENGGGKADIIIIYQGQVAARRHNLELIEAMRQVPDSVGLALLVSNRANNPVADSCDELIKKYGMENRVVWIPPVNTNEVIQYAVGADIGVLFYRATTPNNRFGSPNKLYEYMMAGLPMVASNTEGLQAVIGQHGLGKLVDSANPSSIAEGINELIADPEQLKRIGEKAKQLFAEKLNYKVAGQTLVNCFDLVTGHQSSDKQ